MSIYYNPEKYGVKSVFDVDKSDGCYQFDQFVIWQGVDRYYWASDAGCSCPSPFEWVGLDEITQGTLLDAVNDARVWVSEYGDYPGNSDIADAKAAIERFATANGLT
jgi:hypothetical protein